MMHPTFTDRANLRSVSASLTDDFWCFLLIVNVIDASFTDDFWCFFANWKCDWRQFYWLRGFLDVAMVVNLLLTYPDLT